MHSYAALRIMQKQTIAEYVYFDIQFNIKFAMVERFWIYAIFQSAKWCRWLVQLNPVEYQESNVSLVSLVHG